MILNLNRSEINSLLFLVKNALAEMPASESFDKMDEEVSGMFKTDFKCFKSCESKLISTLNSYKESYEF